MFPISIVSFLFKDHHVGIINCTVACEVVTNVVPPLILPSGDDNEKTMIAVVINNYGRKFPLVSYQAHHGNVSNKKQKKAEKGQPISTICSTLSLEYLFIT